MRILKYVMFGVLGAYLSSCGGDSEEDMTIDCTASDLSVDVASKTKAACNLNGSLTLSSSGGEGSVTFSVDGETNSSGEFELPAGDYTAAVEDSEGCTSTVSFTIEAEESAIVLEVGSTEAGCGTSNGSITVNAEGGSGNFTYQLNDGSFQSSNTFQDLEAGQYQITVKDSEDCDVSKNVQVASGTSLENDIIPIVNSTCAISGCHVAGTGRVDFTEKENILQNANDMNTRVQNGSMPKTGSISQEDKDLLECWVNDGAPDN